MLGLGLVVGVFREGGDMERGGLGGWWRGWEDWDWDCTTGLSGCWRFGPRFDVGVDVWMRAEFVGIYEVEGECD